MLVVGGNKRQEEQQIEGGEMRRGGARSNRNPNTKGWGNQRGSGWWASTSEQRYVRGVSCAQTPTVFFYFFLFPTHLLHHHQCPVLPCPLFSFVLENDSAEVPYSSHTSAWSWGPAKRFKLNVSNGGRAQSKSDSSSFRVFLFFSPTESEQKNKTRKEFCFLFDFVFICRLLVQLYKRVKRFLNSTRPSIHRGNLNIWFLFSFNIINCYCVWLFIVFVLFCFLFFFFFKWNLLHVQQLLWENRGQEFSQTLWWIKDDVCVCIIEDANHVSNNNITSNGLYV